jgi:hypothetical protein
MSYFDYQATKAHMPAKARPVATYRTVRTEYSANVALRATVRK